MTGPAQRRKAVREVQQRHGLSERRACQVMEQPRSTQRYQPKARPAEETRLVQRIRELVRKYPRYGYRMITAKLRQEGWRVNFKRVYRLWRREGFRVPQKRRKKRALGQSANSCCRRRAERKNHVWTWDFVFDRTRDGRALKWFAVLDEYTRECLVLEVAWSITADRVLDLLTDLIRRRGVPEHIRSDNGPEFVADAIKRHCRRCGLEVLYIEPGAPWENGYAESFFSRLRHELLSAYEFEDLAQAKQYAKQFQDEHNYCRPHSSLGYCTPVEFASRLVDSAPATPPLRQPTARPDGYVVLS